MIWRPFRARPLLTFTQKLRKALHLAIFFLRLQRKEQRRSVDQLSLLIVAAFLLAQTEQCDKSRAAALIFQLRILLMSISGGASSYGQIR